MADSKTEPKWNITHAGAPERWVPQSVGEYLTGNYVGFEDIEYMDDATKTMKTIRYYDVRDFAGCLWSLPNSYQIEKGFEGIVVGSLIRITYMGELDLGKKGRNPMKNYRFEVAQ